VTRYITLWRLKGDRCLDWDHYTSEDEDELSRTVGNLRSQGYTQYSSYELGPAVPEYCDESTAKSLSPLEKDTTRDELTTLVESAAGIFHNSSVESGYCCCGDAHQWMNRYNLTKGKIDAQDQSL